MNGNALFGLSGLLALLTLGSLAATDAVNMEKWDNLTSSFSETQETLKEHAEAFNQSLAEYQSELNESIGDYTMVNLDTNETIGLDATEEEMQDFLDTPGDKIIIPSSDQEDIDSVLNNEDFQDWYNNVNKSEKGVYSWVDPETNQSIVMPNDFNTSDYLGEDGNYSPQNMLGQGGGETGSDGLFNNPDFGNLLGSLGEGGGAPDLSGFGDLGGLGDMGGLGDLGGLPNLNPNVQAPDLNNMNLPSNLGNLGNIPNIDQFLWYLLPLLLLPILYFVIKYLLSRHLLKSAKKTKHVTEVEAEGEGLGAKYGKGKGKGVNILHLDPLFDLAIVSNLVTVGDENSVEFEIVNKTKEDIGKVEVSMGGSSKDIGLMEKEEKRSVKLDITEKISEKSSKLKGKVKFSKMKYKGKKYKEMSFKLPVKVKKLAEEKKGEKKEEKKTPASTKCYRHSDKDAIAKCVKCGNLVCGDCFEEIDEKVYCHDCLKKMMEESV